MYFVLDFWIEFYLRFFKKFFYEVYINLMNVYGFVVVLQVCSKVDDNNFDEILDDVLVNICFDEEVVMFVDMVLFCINILFLY